MRRFVFMIVLFVMVMPGVALADTEHCPDHNGHPGKIESVVDGDIDDIVLDAGTVFCVKGSTSATGKLTADGETSLRTYLNIDKNVSYYVVYETPSTTTTTTQPEETTTTTIVEETTTTNVEESTTTTNVEEETTTTANDETTSTENDDTETPTSEEGEVLPFTGVNGYYFLIALGLSLAGLAALGYASRFVKE